jgi:hypothetical protein
MSISGTNCIIVFLTSWKAYLRYLCIECPYFAACVIQAGKDAQEWLTNSPLTR